MRIIIITLLFLVSFGTNAFWDEFFGQDNESSVVVDQKKLSKFRNDYKLLFVYTSSCGYCHRFAPVLRSFVNDKKIKVDSISEDGKGINGFDNPKYSPQTLDDLGVRSYPTLFVTDKNNKVIETLTNGYIDKSTLTSKFNDLLESLY